MGLRSISYRLKKKPEKNTTQEKKAACHANDSRMAGKRAGKLDESAATGTVSSTQKIPAIMQPPRNDNGRRARSMASGHSPDALTVFSRLKSAPVLNCISMGMHSTIAVKAARETMGKTDARPATGRRLTRRRGASFALRRSVTCAIYRAGFPVAATARSRSSFAGGSAPDSRRVSYSLAPLLIMQKSHVVPEHATPDRDHQQSIFTLRRETMRIRKERWPTFHGERHHRGTRNNDADKQSVSLEKPAT